MSARTSAWRAVPAAAAIARQWRVGDVRGLPEVWRHGATLAGVVLAAARSRPGAVLLVDDRGPVRGGELAAAVSRISAQIAALGPYRRAEVAICAGSHRGFVAAVASTGTLGLDAVVAGPHLGDRALARLLAEVDVAVVDPVTATRVRSLAPQVRQVDCAGPAGPADPADPAGPTSGPAPPRPRGGRPGGLRLLSSGTTGTPTLTSRAGAGIGQLPTVLSLMGALGLRRSEPVLLAPSLAHGHGLSVLVAALVVGAPAVLAHGQDGQGLLQKLREQHVGVAAVVPAQLAGLLQAVRADGTTGLGSLRRVAAGSAPLPGELVDGVQTLLGAEPVDFYGTSEVGTATIATPADLRAAPGTVGRPAAGVLVEIVDGHGRSLPSESLGQVRVSSPWRAQARASTQLAGDLGHLDQAGRLFLHSRADGVVVVGGHNVSIEEVRSWFAAQPGVEEVAISAVGHERLGSVLEARVHTTGSLAGLHAQARAALGDAAAPRRLLPW
ncbi:MAG TPA: AMP-binding protein [Ruania sp.]|nr:AMP-binding protein [Ruania sp.]